MPKIGGPVPRSPNIPAALLKLRVRQQSRLLSTGHGAAAVSRIFGNFFNSVHCLLKSIDFRLQHMAVDSNPAFNFSRPEWQLPGTFEVTQRFIWLNFILRYKATT